MIPTSGRTFVVSVDSSSVTSFIRGFRPKLYTKIVGVVQRLALMLVAKVKEEKLSGQVLNVRTGTLRRSIYQQLSSNTSRVCAFVGTNVEYAGIHEFGGTVPEVTGKLMVFPKPGLDERFMTATGNLKGKFARERDLLVFTMKHKAFTLPARSFLRSALEEMEPIILAEVNRATAEVARG